MCLSAVLYTNVQLFKNVKVIICVHGYYGCVCVISFDSCLVGTQIVFIQLMSFTFSLELTDFLWVLGLVDGGRWISYANCP